MLNPLIAETQELTASTVVERHAVQMPKGRRAAVVTRDGIVLLFGNEESRAKNKLSLMTSQLARLGVEVVSVAIASGGRAWAVVGCVAPPRSKARQFEEELKKLIDSMWRKRRKPPTRK
jgi:hypothetical protein